MDLKWKGSTLLVLAPITGCQPTSINYATLDDCVLDSAQKVRTDRALDHAVRVCRKKFPAAK
jgi:hypothetical protein